MENSGMNMQTLKSKNRTLVLYLLNEHKALSRKEIATRLSLTPAGVTKICQSLIDDGFIVESETVSTEGKTGRREILLRLNTDDKFVLGINAEKDNLTLSYSNLSGKLIAVEKHPFIENVDDVISLEKAFVCKNNIELSRVLGMGVCVIGSVNDNDFGIWNDAHLQKRFEDAFGVNVVIENNVKAFAQSELLFGNLNKTKSVLFLKWGAGIGSSIITNGDVITGNDNGVTEIGHYIVDHSGSKCRCGRFGCLETVASADAIMSEINQNLTLDEIIASVDNDIINLIDTKIDLVALALTNTATILNADSIVLFGKMFKNGSISTKLIKQCVRYNSNLSEDMIKVSCQNEISDYIGTIAICAKKHFYELA